MLAALPAPANAISGDWQFRIDKDAAWSDVQVPHTWQTAASTAGYLGVAWYRKVIDAPAAWKGQAVRIEFEAVFHSAVVTLNGVEIGRHEGKGYTAFCADATKAIKPGAANTLEVRVDNSFRTDILPRDNSYDWTPDGGIIRPVNILVTPLAFPPATGDTFTVSPGCARTTAACAGFSNSTRFRGCPFIPSPETTR